MLNNVSVVVLWEILEMPPVRATDARTPTVLGVELRFLRASTRSQQRRCYWISNERTNDRKHRAANGEWPNDIPALVKQAAVILTSQQMRFLE